MNVLIKKLILLATLAGFVAMPALSADKHKAAGPNGGRVLTSVKPHVEFFVTTDRKIQLTFLDETNKAIAPAGQSVTVTTGSRTKPTVLTFAQRDHVLVSNAGLPEGNNLPVVVAIQSPGSSTPVMEKFNANLSICGECKHAEYACTCDH